MDDALCGGGDPAEGYPNTAVPLPAAAVSAIRAAIFMGDPRYVHGLAYNVGSCQAQGVRNHLHPLPTSVAKCSNAVLQYSLLPATSASFAQAATRSSRIATLQTRTAATATTQTLTRAMVRSTASRLLLLSTASSGKELDMLISKIHLNLLVGSKV